MAANCTQDLTLEKGNKSRKKLDTKTRQQKPQALFCCFLMLLCHSPYENFWQLLTLLFVEQQRR